MASRTARQKFRRRVRASLNKADQEFRGQYSSEIDALLGLSREQVDELTPDGTDLAAYNNLINVVKEASRMNADATDLRDSIGDMGKLAVDIAKMVPSLARIL